MRNKLIKPLGSIGFVLVLALIGAACFTVFRAAFTDIAGMGDFISAFTGAFFAFIFVKLGELGTRLYTRQRSNQVALVALEQTLQEHINRLYGNEFVANDIIKTIDATVADPNDASKVNFNFLKPVPIDRSLLLNLRNIDYVNDVFNFYADLEKLNGSMESIQRYYDLMTANLMSGQLSKQDYLNNLPVIREKLEELKRFIDASVDDCVEVAAKTRLLLKEKMLWLTSVIQLGPQNYSEKLKSGVVAEKKNMRAEMDENTKTSREKLKKL